VVDATLTQCTRRACEEMGLWPDDDFVLKVTQLDELLVIRHCVFVMGPAAAAKSSCWRTLAQARLYLGPDKQTSVFDINPKVVPTAELYGFMSLATREWRDGLLSSLMRDVGNINDDKPKYVLLLRCSYSLHSLASPLSGGSCSTATSTPTGSSR